MDVKTVSLRGVSVMLMRLRTVTLTKATDVFTVMTVSLIGIPHWNQKPIMHNKVRL